MTHKRAWLVVILLAAALLRLAALDEIPPGLTHDEADHGLDAYGVVNGVRPIYFTVGYGREPLYDYSTAGLMAFMGPSYMAGRLTAVFFSLILVAGSYAWIRRAFDGRVALLAAAGVAVSFWAVMTGRQALRSVTFPATFALAVYFYWTAVSQARNASLSASSLVPDWRSLRSLIPSFTAAAVLLGVTFYAYLPARIMWVIFPAFLIFLLLFDRRLLAKIWPGTVIMLLIAGLIAAPLFIFLANNPGTEERLGQLSGPLEAAVRGDFDRLITNATASLKLLTSQGDELSRYNIPGRPFLALPQAVLFLPGLAIAIWWVIDGIRHRERFNRGSAAFFSLSWLVVGLSPALITGPDASTTRAIAIQPVLYLFPAIPLSYLLSSRLLPRRLTAIFVAALYAVVFLLTARDYFVVWANDPQVRVQYESALVSALHYLDQSGEESAAVSTTTPDRYHSPSVALLTAENPALSIRWFNGQHSLVAPQDGPSTVIFSGFAPLDPQLEGYFQAEVQTVLPMRPSDIDRPLTVHTADGEALASSWRQQFQDAFLFPAGHAGPLQFGQVAELVGYDLQTPFPIPGSEIRLATLWQVKEPLENAVIFTQVLGDDGLPIAQADRLDVPGYYWQPGDYFIQLHRLQLPDAATSGEYPLIVGLYTRPDLLRQPVIVDGVEVGDYARLPSLVVSE